MPRLDEAYRNTQTAQWTRVDMLLALFDATLEHLKQAVQATENGDLANALHHRLHATTLVMALQSGLDFRYKDLPEELNKLYEFVHYGLVEGDLKLMQSADKVLSELREGFYRIRPEAIEMELKGEIEPFPTESAIDESI